MALVWLFAAWLAPADLGSEKWEEREAAEARARSVGWMAVPFLMPLASSESPEVRQRVRNLTAKADAILRDAATARKWLESPTLEAGDLERMFLDPAERYGVARSLHRIGLLNRTDAARIADGETPDLVVQFVCGVPFYSTAQNLIQYARYRYRNTRPEPQTETEGEQP